MSPLTEKPSIVCPTEKFEEFQRAVFGTDLGFRCFDEYGSRSDEQRLKILGMADEPSVAILVGADIENMDAAELGRFFVCENVEMLDERIEWFKSNAGE